MFRMKTSLQSRIIVIFEVKVTIVIIFVAEWIFVYSQTFVTRVELDIGKIYVYKTKSLLSTRQRETDRKTSI